MKHPKSPMSFFFQERREAHEERPQTKNTNNQDRQQQEPDDGIMMVYGSTYKYDEALIPEEIIMTTKVGKVAMEVAKLQRKIMEEESNRKAMEIAEKREEAPKKEQPQASAPPKREEAPFPPKKEQQQAPPKKPTYTKHDWKRAQMLLGSILNAVTVEEARKTMRMFSHSLEEYKLNNNGSSLVSPYVQAVLEAGGTVSMVVALEQWYTKSEECSLLAMGALATLVVSDHTTSAHTIACIGGISTIFKVVKQYPKSQMVSSDAIEVLCSLAAQAITRPLVASEECRELVQTAMAQFPMDEDIQLEGCEYFLEIGKLDGIKEDLLQEKKLGKLLGHALDQFREDVSQRAVQWYSS